MRHRHKRTFTLVSGICLIFILFHYLGWLTPVEVFLRGAVSPVSRTMYQWSVNIHDEKEQFDSVSELEGAYVKVRQALVDNQVDQVAFAVLQKENEPVNGSFRMESCLFSFIGIF